MFVNILSAYADCNSDVFGDTTWLLKYFPKLAVLDPRKVDVSHLPILDASVIPPEIRDPIYCFQGYQSPQRQTNPSNQKYAFQ